MKLQTEALLLCLLLPCAAAKCFEGQVITAGDEQAYSPYFPVRDPIEFSYVHLNTTGAMDTIVFEIVTGDQYIPVGSVGITEEGNNTLVSLSCPLVYCRSSEASAEFSLQRPPIRVSFGYNNSTGYVWVTLHAGENSQTFYGKWLPGLQGEQFAARAIASGPSTESKYLVQFPCYKEEEIAELNKELEDCEIQLVKIQERLDIYKYNYYELLRMFKESEHELTEARVETKTLMTMSIIFGVLAAALACTLVFACLCGRGARTSEKGMKTKEEPTKLQKYLGGVERMGVALRTVS